jgi:hypothetical protein
MSLGHGASVVRDGLVLHLDAANVKSYLGSGTTWYDLSGNGNNGTLLNGVGYSDQDNGSMVFDGVNDYTTFGSIPLGNDLQLNSTDFTMNFLLWVSSTQSNNFPRLIDKSNSSNGGGGYALIWNPPSNAYIYVANGTLRENEWTSPVCPTDQWYSMTFISRFNSTASMYINGEHALTADLHINNFPPNTVATLNIGNWYTLDTNRLLTGNIASAKIYNRALSDAEIKQNFEALRGRYGI